MKKRLKTDIYLEIEEAVAICTRRVLFAYCQGCRKQVRMVAANEAAVIAGLSEREVFHLVEKGRLHFIEDQCGVLFICLASLEQPGFERRR